MALTCGTNYVGHTRDRAEKLMGRTCLNFMSHGVPYKKNCVYTRSPPSLAPILLLAPLIAGKKKSEKREFIATVSRSNFTPPLYRRDLDVVICAPSLQTPKPGRLRDPRICETHSQ